jgi:hypothetical protein
LGRGAPESLLPGLFGALAVLERLGDVGRFDIVAGAEIGDGAGHFEDAMEGAGGEGELADSDFEQAPGLVVEADLDDVSALTWTAVAPAAAKRADWRARAASTRTRTLSDDSPRAPVASFWKSTRGTSMKRSIRSSSGPEMRRW